jgi:hypothetical protein
METKLNGSGDAPEFVDVADTPTPSRMNASKLAARRKRVLNIKLVKVA